MTSKIYTIDEIKSMLADVAPEYDVERIYLFGSYARGEATEESDLDLYVENFEFKPFHSIFNFMGRMEDIFGKNVDVVSSGAERFAKDSFDRSLFESIKKEVDFVMSVNNLQALEKIEQHCNDIEDYIIFR